MSTPATKALDHGATPWLLGVAVLTTAPHVLHQPLWLSAMAGLVLLWGAWLWQGDRRLPGRWVLFLLVALTCAGILVEFRTLLGRDAGVAMLVMLMALKPLELKSRRDALVIVILGFFLLLTHYFYSQSLATGAWLFATLWLVIAALVRIHGGPASPFRASLRLAASLLLQALPMMLVLYLLFPRINGPLWGLPQDAHAGQTGLSDQMTPGSIAQLVQNGAIAFRTRFDGPLPPRDKLYWRGPVMENFDGQTWRPSSSRIPAERIEAIGGLVAYETTLEASNQRWLLTLDAPTGLPPESSLNGRLTASAKQDIVQRQRFRLSSSLDFRFNVREETAVLTRNLALPSGLNPQTRALAVNWKNSGKMPPAIVNQALALFAGREFAYTLRPPTLGNNAIDDFIFRTRRGFCEHYAAAFVVLMRAAGIPARVVGGYLGGERNPLDGYLVVRQSDAHAWAEVWLEGRGWIRVDPTSVVAPARLESGIGDALAADEPLPGLIHAHSELLRSLRYRWEALNNAWNQQVLGYDPQRQRELFQRLGLDAADWKNLAILLAASCALLLAGLAGWTLYQRPMRDPASRLWHKALRHLARRQVNWAPWETPRTIAQHVREERPELGAAFERVVEAYLQTRYGQTPGDLKSLRDAVARLP